MDLLNGAGVSGGKQNGTNPKTLNVIAPDHPFWNQSVLPTQKMSMLEHQFFLRLFHNNIVTDGYPQRRI